MPYKFYRVKNHVATAPAITICWHPITNCDIQNSASTLYQRVAIIVLSLTNLALALFSAIKMPALSIQMAKYSQNDTTVASAINVYPWNKAHVSDSLCACKIYMIQWYSPISVRPATMAYRSMPCRPLWTTESPVGCVCAAQISPNI